MSRSLIFSVFDSQAGNFSAPFLERSKESASRAFSDALMGGEHHLFSKWPEDFALHVLATFDDETGLIVAVDRDVIISGSDVLRRAGQLSPSNPSDESANG